jgi:hypothetical protein
LEPINVSQVAVVGEVEHLVAEIGAIDEGFRAADFVVLGRPAHVDESDTSPFTGGPDPHGELVGIIDQVRTRLRTQLQESAASLPGVEQPGITENDDAHVRCFLFTVVWSDARLIDHDAVAKGEAAAAVARVPAGIGAIYRGWMLSSPAYASLAPR